MQQTFLCRPSETTSKIPEATNKTIRRKKKPPLLRIYVANLFKYCNMANRKKCNVLSGCLVSVKFCKSVLCLARSSGMTLPPTLDQLRDGGAAADIFRRPIAPTLRRAKTLHRAAQRHQSHHGRPPGSDSKLQGLAC